LSFRKTLTIKKGEIIVRVFVTGATGFIGSHVVKEHLAAGYEVLGLARSDASTQALNAVGANVQRGSLEDIKSLKSGTTASEAVIHLGMSHDLSDLLKVFEIDKQAIEAMGSVLAGSDRPLIVATGIGGLAGRGQFATEETDTASPRVHPPLSVTCASCRLSAHPLLWLPGKPIPRTEINSLPRPVRHVGTRTSGFKSQHGLS
jgi:NAD dependent epimerase/dehydratase family